MAEEILPHYSFLPWLRQGISNQITEVENKGSGSSGDNLERAAIDLKLKIQGNGATVSEIDQEAQLIGPGDIVGINTSAIIKSDPLNWVTNFEPNYLPYIDFYDEDFAWRYSPAVANTDHQLRPWLFLVVLKEGEFTTQDPTNGPLPSIKIEGDGATSTFLPKPDELTAWAHIHVNDNLDPSDIGDATAAVARLTTIIKDNPDLAHCRIICPRKLEQNTSYHAFLIPTYETGRLAGLGVDAATLATIPAQTASWGTAHTTENDRWPIYFNWFFKTGNAGDFEYLVRQLQPKVMDDEVGRRPMDIQNANYGLEYQVELATEEFKTTLSLEGALTVPGTSGESYPYPDAEDDINYNSLTDTNFREQMQDLVNLGEDLRGNTFLATSSSYYGNLLIGGENLDDDPIVAPPLYGRWHALTDKVEADNTDGPGSSAGWIHELNLDPRNRVVAGIGTSIVQEKQDVLMDQAWSQLGDVMEANKKLNWAQLMRESVLAMYKKHIVSQPGEKTWAMTGQMKKRIKSGAKTFHQIGLESQLPLAAEDRSMRRIMRPIGPVMRRVDPQQSINDGTNNLIDKLDNNVLAAVEEKTAPDLAQTTNRSPLHDATSIALALNVSGYNFDLKAIGDTTPSAAPNNTEAIGFKTAVSEFDIHFIPVNWPLPYVRPPFDLANSSTIKDEIDPVYTFPARVYKRIVFDKPVTTPADRIVPVLAYPKFRQPMYEAIRDLSTDLLIPNLNLVPNNCLSLLQTNQKFIESFMVGLNHEMGRELLWREYPTDQRGSYFRQFWDVADNVNTGSLSEEDLEELTYDIPEVHTWESNTNLGDHNQRVDGSGDDEAKLVLLIRGDLLKKYPNTIVYAIKADWQRDGSSVPQYDLPRRPLAGTELYPIFGATINPDMTFIGFDLTSVDARGDDPETCSTSSLTECDPGYFFVLKERPGEPRFGMDIEPTSLTPFDTWNDLHWGHINSTETIELGALVSPPASTVVPGSSSSVTWDANMNSAEMAMVLYQNPVMVCVHAREMLK